MILTVMGNIYGKNLAYLVEFFPIILSDISNNK